MSEWLRKFVFESAPHTDVEAAPGATSALDQHAEATARTHEDVPTRCPQGMFAAEGIDRYVGIDKRADHHTNQRTRFLSVICSVMVMSSVAGSSWSSAASRSPSQRSCLNSSSSAASRSARACSLGLTIDLFAHPGCERDAATLNSFQLAVVLGIEPYFPAGDLPYESTRGCTALAVGRLLLRRHFPRLYRQSFQQPHAFDPHTLLHRLAHVVDRERSHRGSGERLHLHAGLARRLDGCGDSQRWSLRRARGPA